MQEYLALLLLGFAKWVIIPLLTLCLLHAVVNMCLLRRLVPLPLPSPFPETAQDVAVLVPARNEERRIRACLESLFAQEPPVREIILLDDRSTDRTAAIAQELGFSEEAGSPRRLLRGQELPEGWVGKNWACHQLSIAADPASSHLLFTDADTIHHAACVRTSLAHARAERADLLSLWPDQITGTWSEKLVIPLGYLLFMAFHPFLTLTLLQAKPERVKKWGFSRARLAFMGAANGQFLMFARDSYAALGGHEALKDHLVEDIAFGRRVAARTGEGMRLVNADGIDLLRCRMYSGFGELWEGFSKNLRPVFEESYVAFLLFGVAVGGLFLLPFLLLSWSALFPVVGISILLIVLLRLVLTVRFRTSWIGFVFHPVGILLAMLIALNSWRLCRAKEIRWKGRLYPGATRSSLT